MPYLIRFKQGARPGIMRDGDSPDSPMKTVGLEPQFFEHLPRGVPAGGNGLLDVRQVSGRLEFDDLVTTMRTEAEAESVQRDKRRELTLAKIARQAGLEPKPVLIEEKKKRGRPRKPEPAEDRFSSE